jgi:hypothetical protein
MKFISKELSIKLKEKGFDRPCFGYYINDKLIMNLTSIHLPFGGNVYDTMYSSNGLCENDIADAPTTDQVLEWLREDCGLYISMACSRNYDIDADGRILGSWVYWWYEIYSHLSADLIYQEEEKEYDTYDEAILDGIKYVINNLI